jgi:hypothetical protein
MPAVAGMVFVCLLSRRFERGAKRSGRFGIMNNHRKYQQDENNQQ